MRGWYWDPQRRHSIRLCMQPQEGSECIVLAKCCRPIANPESGLPSEVVVDSIFHELLDLLHWTSVMP